MDLRHFNEPNITRMLVDCSDFKNIYKDIKGISFFHLNISSLLKHIDGLSALNEQLIPFEIIAITETRISKESIPHNICLLYTSPSPRDATLSRMPSSA